MRLSGVSVLDAILASCLAVAFATGLACYSIPAPSAVTPIQTDLPTYYPTPRAVEPLTLAAHVPIIPAHPVAAPSRIQQLSKSGKNFRSVFGVEPVEEAFWLSKWYASDSFYGGRWAPENVVNTVQGAEFRVEREPDTHIPFSMAEAKSQQRFGYGRYEAVMQIGKGSGLVSAFFTYTGPYDGDPHDEIDIEFLGKDTSKIEFNYWRSGKRGKHAIFDLPFDASAAPHLYAFEWAPDRITWYVDGVAYYATEANDAFIPQHAGRLFFSHWTGTPPMQGWHGKPEFDSGEAMIVSCASFTPANKTAPACGDSFQPTLAGSAGNPVYATLSP